MSATEIKADTVTEAPAAAATTTTNTTTTPAQAQPGTRQLKSAAVVGGTGQVGRHVVNELLATPGLENLVLIGRRPFPNDTVRADPRVHEVIIDPMTQANIENSDSLAASLNGVDALFITMGVGQPSKVSPEDLAAGDVALPFSVAKVAAEAKVSHTGLLTAMGTNVTSTSWFGFTGAGFGLYNRFKGLIEEQVKRLPFSSVAIYRPAAILENPNTGSFANWLFPKISGILPANYSNTTATDLGRAMVHGAVRALSGDPLPSTELKEPSSADVAATTEDFNKQFQGKLALPPVAPDDTPPANRFTYEVARIHELIRDWRSRRGQ